MLPPSVSPRPRTSVGRALPRHLPCGLLLGSVLVGVLASLAGCAGTGPRGEAAVAEAPPAPSITPDRVEAHLASFDQIWETIRDVHYDPELNGAPWDELRETLRPRVAAARTDGEARSAMEELLASLGQSHFGVIPGEVYDELDRPSGPDGSPAESGSAGGESGAPVASSRNPGGIGQPGFDVVVVGDQAIVRRVVPGSPAERAGVAMGWVLSAVDGHDVSKGIAALREHLDGGEAELVLRRMALANLAGDPGETARVTFLAEGDASREVTIELIPPKHISEPFGNMPRTAVDWEITRIGDIGLFRLGIFLHFSVRLELEAFLDENPDLRGLVIDLRGNPGGIGFMANGICGHLVDESNLRLGTMLMRDQSMHFNISPQATVFGGPVALLIDGGSASTSEIMAAGLQDLGRARLFGSNTAGAALPSVFVRLPNGDGFQFAVANYVSTGGSVLEGSGVAPDEVVWPERSRLLEGVDPPLAAALEWIRQQ